MFVVYTDYSKNKMNEANYKAQNTVFFPAYG
jgi:hypothetical protein